MLIKKHYVGLSIIGAVLILICILAFSLFSYFPLGYGIFPTEHMSG